MRNIIHIVRGLPGTGKSTFVRNTLGGMLQIENDQFWITPDGKYEYDKDHPQEARVKCDTYTRNMVIAAMQNKVNLAVSRVGMHEKSIRELIELAKTFDYEYKIWLMDEGNQNSIGSSFNSHNVPKEAMDFMRNGFIKTLPWIQELVIIKYEGNQIDGFFHNYYYRSIPGSEPVAGESP